MRSMRQSALVAIAHTLIIGKWQSLCVHPMLEPLRFAGLIKPLTKPLISLFIGPSVIQRFPLPHLYLHECVEYPTRASIGGLNLQPVPLISFRYHCRIFLQYSKHGAFQAWFLAQVTVD